MAESFSPANGCHLKRDQAAEMANTAKSNAGTNKELEAPTHAIT